MNIIIFLGGDYNNTIHSTQLSLLYYLSNNNCKVFCFEYPRFRNIISIFLKKLPLIEHIIPNVLIFHSFGILPLGRTFSSINRLNHRVNYFIFKQLMANKIKKSTVITFTPETLFVLSQTEPKNKIFYFVKDEYLSLPYWSSNLQKKQFMSLEKEFLGRVYKVITVSERLLHKYKNLSGNVVYFPNPADLSDFSSYPLRNNNKPIDLVNIPNPIIGFVGTFYDWKIDMKFFIKTLNNFPNASFVVIGPLEIKDKNCSKLLFKQKNFYYLGSKRHSVLGEYIKAFDVCIIPYKIDSFGKSAYPIKTYEYLYFGKPVVTTALPALKHLSNKKLIYWAKNDKEFIQLIEKAFNGKTDQELVNARIKEAKKNDWSIRIHDFIDIFNN